MQSVKPIPPLGVRLPSDLKDQIKASATANRRSMNSEIVTMLESVVGRSPETKKGEVTA